MVCVFEQEDARVRLNEGESRGMEWLIDDKNE
jgi:hypothetical protein